MSETNTPNTVEPQSTETPAAEPAATEMPAVTEPTATETPITEPAAVPDLTTASTEPATSSEPVVTPEVTMPASTDEAAPVENSAESTVKLPWWKKLFHKDDASSDPAGVENEIIK